MVLFNKIKKTYFVAVVLIVSVTNLNAQNNTASPYSISGIGEIDNGLLAKNSALGGLTTPLFSENHYSLVNPASLGFINKSIIDFGLRADKGILSTENGKRDYNNGNFNYFAIGFRVLDKKNRIKPDTIFNADKTIQKIKQSKDIFTWGSGISFNPYSNVGGDLQSKVDADFGSPLFVNSAQGGLSKVSFNNGFKIGEYFSIGYSASFLWGQIAKTQLITFPDSQNITTFQSINFVQYSGFNHNIGAGFNFPIDKNSTISAGLSFSPSFILNSKHNKLVRSSDYNKSGNLVILDTVFISTDNKSTATVPGTFNAGINYTLKNKFSLGAEYSSQNWSEVVNKGWNENLSDYNRLSIGLTINPESEPTISMHSPEIYLGFHISDLTAVYYENNKMKPIKENGISFGIGLPVVRDIYTETGKRERYKSMIYITGEYISRGAVTEGRVKEDLFRVSLGMSLTDLWFMKRKYR